MKLSHLKLFRDVCLFLTLACYFLAASAIDQSVAGSAQLFVATACFGGCSYFANSLIYHAKLRIWRRKRAARLANEKAEAEMAHA